MGRTLKDKVALVAGATRGAGRGIAIELGAAGGLFHTYSTYVRGLDMLNGAYNYLDMTPLGRQEDWEQPPGRSNSPFGAWVRHHDKYEEIQKAPTSCCGLHHEG